MKDPIIRSYLQQFRERFEVASEESVLFEHFAAYCLVSREFPETFDPAAICTGGGGDMCIDGIATFVNGQLVTTREQIEGISKLKARLSVKFLFIQAKTSEKFDMGYIGNFLYGVQAFFSDTLPAHASDAIRLSRGLKDYLYELGYKMTDPPACELYYVTTGQWNAPREIVTRVEKELNVLRATKNFRDVQFFPIDGEKLKSLYRRVRGQVSKTFTFERHSIIPAMAGVDQAFLGIIPASEFLQLIVDDEGELNRALFYDNVRDFQGGNAVNLEIGETISNRKEELVLLNNGITIVAQDVRQLGIRFTVSDYQIVNGCQTSHIVFKNRNNLTGATLPLKLIATGDRDLTNRVIKATNRQTEVKVEAFESIRPFHKDLEEFYNAMNSNSEVKIYYERRSRQFGDVHIRQEQIISLPIQINCFVAMFLNDPHSTHRYYGELLDTNRSRIFDESHSPYPYYLSALAYYSAGRYMNSGLIDPSLRPFRYHAILLFRLLGSAEDVVPYLNDRKKIDAYCERLVNMLRDEQTAQGLFKKAEQMTAVALSKSNGDSGDRNRTRQFTASLIQAASQGSPRVQTSGDRWARPSRSSVKVGAVVKFDVDRGFGFIRDEDGLEYFVHFTAIRALGFRALRVGQTVEFYPGTGPKGLIATDVAPRRQ
jgi:cold shock CspA family protein